MAMKDQIMDDIKAAMRAKDQKKLSTLRLITAAIKQVEVDERTAVDESRLLDILSKMIKQRKESITLFEQAGRNDLVQQEQEELDIIHHYLPTPLSESEIITLVQDAISQTQAQKMADMGKVMAHLKPQVQGRVDMSRVSALIKSALQTG